MSKEREKPRERRFTDGEVTVVWKPDQCIHSGKCVKGLPEVFRPKERPWVALGGVSGDAVLQQVGRCPSGALSGFRNAEGEPATAGPAASFRVEVSADGPLLVHGPVVVRRPDGTEESHGKTAALCRCGSSANKPYCDGSHRKSGFRDG